MEQDPLEGYSANWRQRMGGQQGDDDPLAGYSADWRKKTGWEDQRNLTAMGRRQVRGEVNQLNAAKLRELLKKPNIKPVQRQRVESLLKKFETGEVDNAHQTSQDPMSNAARGAMMGTLNVIPGAADLVGTGIEYAGKGLTKAGITDKVERLGRGVRDVSQEAMMKVREAVNPDEVNSKVQNVTEVGSGLIAGSKVYGPIANLAAKPFMVAGQKLAPGTSKAIVDILNKSEGGKRILGYMAANVAQGLPLNLLQYTSMDEFPKDERIKQLLIGIGADAVFGGVHGASSKPMANLEKPITEPLPQEKQDLIGDLATKRAKATAEAEVKKEMTKGAKKEWQTANPTKEWKKLSREERERVVAEYQAKRVAEAGAGTAQVGAVDGGVQSGGPSAEKIRSNIATLEKIIADPKLKPETKAKFEESLAKLKDKLPPTPGFSNAVDAVFNKLGEKNASTFTPGDEKYVTMWEGATDEGRGRLLGLKSNDQFPPTFSTKTKWDQLTPEQQATVRKVVDSTPMMGAAQDALKTHNNAFADPNLDKVNQRLREQGYDSIESYMEQYYDFMSGGKAKLSDQPQNIKDDLRKSIIEYFSKDIDPELKAELDAEDRAAGLTPEQRMGTDPTFMSAGNDILAKNPELRNRPIEFIKELRKLGFTMNEARNVARELGVGADPYAQIPFDWESRSQELWDDMSPQDRFNIVQGATGDWMELTSNTQDRIIQYFKDRNMEALRGMGFSTADPNLDKGSVESWYKQNRGDRNNPASPGSSDFHAAMMDAMGWDYMPYWEALSQSQKDLLGYIKGEFDRTGKVPSSKDVLKAYDDIRLASGDLGSDSYKHNRTIHTDVWNRMSNDKRREFLSAHNIDPGYADWDAEEFGDLQPRIRDSILEALQQSFKDAASIPNAPPSQYLKGKQGDWMAEISRRVQKEIGRELTDAEYEKLSRAVDDLYADIEGKYPRAHQSSSVFNRNVTHFIQDWIETFTRGVQPQITGQAMSGQEWWDSMGIDAQADLLNELGLGEEALRNDGNPMIGGKFENLPIEIQSKLELEAAKRFKDEIDVGRTVDEPSAAERYAALKLDTDADHALTDLIIDKGGHVTKSDIERFAQEWELDPEVAEQALKERLGEGSVADSDGLEGLDIQDLGPDPNLYAIESGAGHVPAAGLSVGWDHQQPIDPKTGLPIDPGTGMLVDPTAPDMPLPTGVNPQDIPLNKDTQDIVWDQVIAGLRAEAQNLRDPTTPLPTPTATPSDPRLSPPSSDLTTLTDAQLDTMKGQLLARLDGGEDVLDQLGALAAETRRRTGGDVGVPREPNPLQALEVTEQGVIRDRDFGETMESRFGPREAELRKLLGKSLRKLTEPELTELIEWSQAKVNEGGDEAPAFQDKLSKLLNERAQRQPPSGPAQANMPKAIGSLAAGIYGAATSDENDDPLWRFLMFAGGAYGTALATESAYKAWKSRQKPIEFFPGEGSLPKAVISGSDLEPPKKTIYEMLRKAYSDVTRGVHGLEKLTQKNNLPANIDPGKLAATFGRYVSTVERWITHKPVVYGSDGEPVYLESSSMADILAGVNGDMDGLGRVATALHSLEKDGVGGYKAPMDIVQAELIVGNAPPEYIQAAQQLRQYNLDLARTQLIAGNLSEDGFNAMAAEEWYAPMHRIFGNKVTRAEVEKIARGETPVISPNPLQNRKKGARQPVINPVERTIEMTSKYLRAMEYAKIKQSYIGWVKALPEGSGRDYFLKRVQNAKNPNWHQYETYATAIRRLIPKMTKDEAISFAVNMGMEKIDPSNPILTVYEDGALRSYRIAPDVFDVFKGMLPTEKGVLDSWMGRMITGTTQNITKGVVYNPAFVGVQAFIDTFQAALQSRYGFRPGLESARGWWHAVRRSPEYQRLLDIGGPATIQSLPYASDPTRAVSATSAYTKAKIAAGGEPSALRLAVEQVKEMHPIEAYKTLMTPIAEAARVGEALRALDHGESTLEAVYAAWHATGNTRMEGTLPLIRALHRITLFSRPAIAALDELVATSGLHPFRTPTGTKVEGGFAGEAGARAGAAAKLLTKGMAFIGLPTAALWLANKDDEQIRELRTTESGSRYWFIRTPEGEIAKIRKPHVIGQLFGTSVEAALDNMYAKDPITTMQVVGGMANDAAVNMLPAIGVVPMSLWANQQWGLGNDIIPQNELALDPTQQGRMDASMPARVISDNVAPVEENLRRYLNIDQESFIGSMMRRSVSPAGMDFIANNVAGMLGQDGLTALNAWWEYSDRGYAPAREEWPIVSRFTAHYPASNTRYVRDFYKNLEHVDEVAKTVDYLTTHDPAKLVPYIQANRDVYVKGPLYKAARDQLEKVWRVQADLQNMYDKRHLDKQQYQRLRDVFMNQVIALTRSVEGVYK